jgi:large subunit ribosomal protein L18
MARNRQLERRRRIKRRIRKKISGTAERPRLTVFRSNRHMYAQLIDDTVGHTIVAASSKEEGSAGENPIARSSEVGKRLAERAKESGIERVVFDRNGYRYHGRVKALAEGAREGGLQL